ncbi:F-box/FBD/LRR-repeat protein [Trifolium repens]|nr:F-box/FBD/LRR-repeat protein [Trifolium repens]
MKRRKRKDRSGKVLKMKRQKESDTDRLSALPDHLLLHITQFMTTKHSAQTSVLSKRWKNLWKCVTNIKLHHLDRYNGVIFDNFVSQFLSGRDNSIPLHSISYVNGCMNYPFPPETNIPVEIMEYAVSLTSLTLCLWAINTTSPIMFPKSLNLPALKTLRLACFIFFTGDNGYAEPFSTCNMLSKLAIFCCNIQDDAQGLCISNSKVSSLAIGTLNPNSNIFKVVVCTPKLTSLTINGSPPAFAAPSSCNLTLFEELKFNCRYGITMGEDILISWLHFLAKVKIVTLNFEFLESMINVLENNGSLRVQLPSFIKLKSLKVEADSSISDERVREMVTYLLQNSPPPSTFLISKEVDKTCDRCLFFGFLCP